MAVTGISANRLELLSIADAVAREKNIDKEIVIEAIEEAIQKGAKSRYGAHHDIRAKIDHKTGELSLTRPIDFQLFEGFEARLETDRMVEGRKRFKGILAGVEGDNVAIDLDGEEDTALIPFEWIADAKLVLTDELLKRGAALRAARGEPEDDGLPEGEAETEDTTNITTSTKDKA